jgi:retinol-binding protein 3
VFQCLSELAPDGECLIGGVPGDKSVRGYCAGNHSPVLIPFAESCVNACKHGRFWLFLFIIIRMEHRAPNPLLALTLIVACIVPDGCRAQKKDVPPATPASIRVVVDSLANQVSKYYIDKPAADKMSAALRSALKQGKYAEFTDPHLLAAKLTSDIQAVHRDEHFHVEYNPLVADELSGNIEDVPGMVAEKLRVEMTRNFGFRKAEVFGGSIGYLEISSFSRLNDYSRRTADAALRLLSNCEALIIDLRYGSGGSPEMMTHLLGRFFAERTHVANIYIRSENATLPYYTTVDSSFSRLHRMPVYILTSYKTFSAAEGFIYAMKSFKRATIVGEATRGGAHTVTYRPLGHGFVADIPFGRAMDPKTGMNWEGTGIAPDVSVPADDALEAAENIIFEKGLASAHDSATVRRIRWSRRLAHATNHPATVDTTELKKFAGNYGAYLVSYEKGCLYYQKTGKAKFPLIYIGDNWLRPKGNDTFIIEVVNDGKGVPISMITLYDDGRLEFASRDRFR